MCIFVVGDEATLRRQLVQAIAAAGHTVEEAAIHVAGRLRKHRFMGLSLIISVGILYYKSLDIILLELLHSSCFSCLFQQLSERP